MTHSGPSQRSLRDYTYHFEAKIDFSDEVDQQPLSHPDICEGEKVAAVCHFAAR